MKFLPLILKHLRHSWIRTTSTILAIVACIFLFCTLQTILVAIDWGLHINNSTRLVVRNGVSLMYYVPITYKEKIRTIPGVKRVSTFNWLLGFFGSDTNPDWTKFFPNHAVDSEEYLAMYPEYILSAAEKQAFLEDRRGCIVGPDTAKKYNWKIGDIFQLRSQIFPEAGPFEFVIEGIYKVDNALYPGTHSGMMLFHYKYLDDAVHGNAQANTLVVEIENPARAGDIAKAIDQMFENSDRPTHTETENAFRAGFISMAGNLTLLLRTIGMAVIFTILLATANTMSMAVRERRKEIAILKTLGFGSGLVMALILIEALFLGASGGALGILLGQMTIKALPNFPMIGDALRQYPNPGLSLAVGAAGIGMAMLMGLAAGFVPALTAYRSRITDMLRTI